MSFGGLSFLASLYWCILGWRWGCDRVPSAKYGQELLSTMTLRRSERGRAARDAIAGSSVWHLGATAASAKRNLSSRATTVWYHGLQAKQQDTQVNLDLLPQVANSFSEAAFSKILLCFSPAGEPFIPQLMLNALPINSKLQMKTCWIHNPCHLHSWDCSV